MRRITGFYNSIVLARNGDQNVMMKLIGDFYPMFDSYARKLHFDNHLEYEDAFSCLQCYFIEMIKTVDLSKITSHTDASLVTYFSHGIYYYYIKLSKNSHRYPTLSLDDQFQGKNGESIPIKSIISSSVEDQHDFELLDLFSSVLTSKESLVIRELILDGFTQNEISVHLGCTPSAVSQLKQSAFKKLRIFYIEEDKANGISESANHPKDPY